LELVRVQNGYPQQAVDRKAAAGCSSPNGEEQLVAITYKKGASKNSLRSPFLNPRWQNQQN
jgi:hypothetical protein